MHVGRGAVIGHVWWEPTPPSPGRASSAWPPQDPTVFVHHHLYMKSSPSDLTLPALCSGSPPHIPPLGKGVANLDPIHLWSCHPLTHHVILGMLVGGKKNFSRPQFPHLENGCKHPTFITPKDPGKPE